MTVLSLDHVNLRTRNVARTLDFFRNVLEMEVVPPPGRANTDEAGWILDDSGLAIVHVGSLSLPYPSDTFDPPVEPGGRGPVHHVALSCTGYEEMKKRFKTRDLVFAENEVPQISLRQLFVQEPSGIMLELNFRQE